MLAMAVVFATASTSAVTSDTNSTFSCLLYLSGVGTGLAALSLIDATVASFPMGSAVALMASRCLTRTCSVLYSSRIQPVLTGLLGLVWLRSMTCTVSHQSTTSVASTGTLPTSHWV